MSQKRVYVEPLKDGEGNPLWVLRRDPRLPPSDGKQAECEGDITDFLRVFLRAMDWKGTTLEDAGHGHKILGAIGKGATKDGRKVLRINTADYDWLQEKWKAQGTTVLGTIAFTVAVALGFRNPDDYVEEKDEVAAVAATKE